VNRYGRWTAFREAGFWIAAIPMLLPIYLVLTTVLRGQEAVGESALRPPGDPTLGNLQRAWSEAGGGTVSFSQALFNSALTTCAAVALLVVTAAPAGYALARRGSKLSGAVFGLFTLALIMPIQLGMIPLYGFMVEAGFTGTRTGLILVYVGLQMPLAVFLYAGFIRGLPTAYEEAATVDGARPLRVFVQVVFPLVRPVTGVVATLTGLFVWNDFFVALVFVGDTDKVTLPVAVYSFVGRFAAQWPLIFAAALIAAGPVVVLFGLAQRTIMKGFTSTLHG
jgi:raffinose/stachyose/melibiose transport system permease protein